ncbi:MAG: DUF493 domain-containing protein [Salinisphaera sp.]|nr:DUF493 domain-containing protein [Salinisphaera sp.]
MKESLLAFPCRFPIKAMGRREDGFEQLVFGLVKTHVPELEAAQLSTRPSRGGTYLAVTVNITARSQGQLDKIYRDLTGHHAVLMAL